MDIIKETIKCPEIMIDFRFGTSFRNNLTDEEEAALDHMLDMMTAIKQQILLRRAMKKESNIFRLKDNHEETL